MSILKEDNNIASSLLKEHNLNYDSIKEELDIMMESGYKPESFPESKYPESADENDMKKMTVFLVALQKRHLIASLKHQS